MQEVDDPQRPGQKMRAVIIRSNVAKMQRLTAWRKAISDQARRGYGLPDKITESKTEHSGTVESSGTNWEAFLAELHRQNQALIDAAEAEGDDAPDWE